LLHRAYDLYVRQDLPRDAAEVNRIIVECYLLLNRNAEARDLARAVSATFRTFGAAYEEAVTLLHLALAEAELANFDAALAALDAAEVIFTSLGTTTWIATTRLRRGRIALRRGDLACASTEARAAAEHFNANGYQVEYAHATLLHGQALLAAADA